jgi:hypothetical protein
MQAEAANAFAALIERHDAETVEPVDDPVEDCA